MMNWKRAVAPALLSVCGAAMGQTLEAYTVVQGSYPEDLSVAPAIAVGPSNVVIAGAHSLRLYDKSVTVGGSGFLLDDEWQSTFPFTPRNVPSVGSAMSLVFPRANYDPISGRTWMMFSEMGAVASSLFEHSGGTVCAPYLHMAVSSATSGAITSFSGSDWHYYTGNSGSPGNRGQAFDLDGSLQLYDVGHLTMEGNAMAPSLAFDDRAIFVVVSEGGVCGGDTTPTGNNPAIIVIPRTHDSGTKSILDGDRPDEGDLLIARIGAPPEVDSAQTMLAVQEPYEQYDNMTLFVSTDGTTSAGVIMQGIRLRGIYNEEPDPNQPAGDWLIRQSLKLNGTMTDVVLADMDVASTYTAFKVGPPPIFESSTFPIAPSSFNPNVQGDTFLSAVLTEDNQGNPRVFAVHAALDQSDTGDGGWVVQWYVIDPKINDFFTTTPAQDTGWNPSIVAIGRIETDGASEPSVGDCYLPVLGVTRSGQVYIEYTFSNDTTYPKVLRAVLNNTYTDAAVTTVAQSGPSAAYGIDYDLWGLYGDMQADPTGCFFWSTHTLVEDADERAAWLFKTPFNCFSTDLNADETTDSYDLAIYHDLFLDGHRRADTDADGVVDLTDMAEYNAAYDAATSP